MPRCFMAKKVKSPSSGCSRESCSEQAYLAAPPATVQHTNICSDVDSGCEEERWSRSPENNNFSRHQHQDGKSPENFGLSRQNGEDHTPETQNCLLRQNSRDSLLHEDGKEGAPIYKEEPVFSIKDEPQEYVEACVVGEEGEEDSDGEEGRFVVDENREEKEFVVDEEADATVKGEASGTIYRPYCLRDPTEYNYTRHSNTISTATTSTTTAASALSTSSTLTTLLKHRNLEDIRTAQAILDLSSPDRTGQQIFYQQQQQQVVQGVPQQLLLPLHTYQIVAAPGSTVIQPQHHNAFNTTSFIQQHNEQVIAIQQPQHHQVVSVVPSTLQQQVISAVPTSMQHQNVATSCPNIIEQEQHNVVVSSHSLIQQPQPATTTLPVHTYQIVSRVMASPNDPKQQVYQQIDHQGQPAGQLQLQQSIHQPGQMHVQQNGPVPGQILVQPQIRQIIPQTVQHIPTSIQNISSSPSQGVAGVQPLLQGIPPVLQGLQPLIQCVEPALQGLQPVPLASIQQGQLSQEVCSISPPCLTTPPAGRGIKRPASPLIIPPVHKHKQELESVSPNPSNQNSQVFHMNGGKTKAYTYEAFFASDGRSKKTGVAAAASSNSGVEVAAEQPLTKAKYTCSECGKHYATSSNLSRHRQTHRTLDSANAKKCPICNKMYVSMPALSMHILTHNLNHKCNICGKAFSRPWLLQGHLRSHTGDKPYGCAHCGKSFADRSNLRAHMQTHSSFKAFKCNRCNKSFALKSYLNKHLESACYKDQASPGGGSTGSGVLPSGMDTPPATPPSSDYSSDHAESMSPDDEMCGEDSDDSYSEHSQYHNHKLTIDHRHFNQYQNNQDGLHNDNEKSDVVTDSSEQADSDQNDDNHAAANESNENSDTSSDNKTKHIIHVPTPVFPYRQHLISV